MKTAAGAALYAFNRASFKLYRSGIFILVPRAAAAARQTQSIGVDKLFAG